MTDRKLTQDDLLCFEKIIEPYLLKPDKLYYSEDKVKELTPEERDIIFRLKAGDAE